MSSFTHYRPTERTRYFPDEDGVMSTTKREDEILVLSIDWSDELTSSEAVSSMAYSDSGVTTSGASLTGNVSTVTVTGIGEVEVTATLDSGSKLQRIYRFYDREGSITTDYGVVTG